MRHCECRGDKCRRRDCRLILSCCRSRWLYRYDTRCSRQSVRRIRRHDQINPTRLNMQFSQRAVKDILIPCLHGGGEEYPSPRHRSARHQIAGRCVDFVSRSHTVEFGEGGIDRRVRGKIAVAEPGGKADAPGAIRQSMNAKAVAARDARIDCMGSHLGRVPSSWVVPGRSGALTPCRSRRVHVSAGQRHVRSCGARWRGRVRPTHPSGVVKACGNHLEGRNINRGMHLHSGAYRASGLIRTIDASDTLRAP